VRRTFCNNLPSIDRDYAFAERVYFVPLVSDVQDWKLADFVPSAQVIHNG
jgi:hypothetical protein